MHTSLLFEFINKIKIYASFRWPGPLLVYRILKFSESSYDAPLYIKQLEEQGRHGDRILLQGIQTGTGIVTVRPVDPAYKVNYSHVYINATNVVWIWYNVLWYYFIYIYIHM